MKTISAALVLCLNIGEDPPDMYKSENSSKVECWLSMIRNFSFIHIIYFWL